MSVLPFLSLSASVVSHSFASLSVCLYLYLPVSLAVSLSVSLMFISLSLSLCACLSFFCIYHRGMSVSFYFSVSLDVSITLSFSVALSLSLALSLLVSLFLLVSLSLFLSVSYCRSLPISLSGSLSLSHSLSPFLSYALKHTHFTTLIKFSLTRIIDQCSPPTPPRIHTLLLCPSILTLNPSVSPNHPLVPCLNSPPTCLLVLSSITHFNLRGFLRASPMTT